MEILGLILTEGILSGIGWVCLYAWHRDRKKIEKIKNEEYAGRYSYVGRVMILNLIAGVGAIAMFGIAIFVLVAWVYRSMTS